MAIKDRRGCSYVRDTVRIAAFAEWLHELGQSGLIGQPCDRAVRTAERY